MAFRPQAQRRDVLACGGLTLDSIYRVSRIPPVHFEAEVHAASLTFGGRAPNVAYMGAKLGLRTGVISPVGGDFESSGYKAHLRKAGVDLLGVVKVPQEPTTRILIFDDGTGNTITFFQLGASKAFRTMEVPLKLIARYSVVHISSSGSRAFNVRVAGAAKRAGCLVSFDPGNDPAIEDVPYVRKMLREASFLFANRKELPWLLKAVNASEAGELLVGGLQVVAVIDKPNARAELHTATDSFETPPARTRVVDLTGASDAFAAGFLLGHLRGEDPRTCAKLGIATLSKVEEAWGSQDGAPTIDALKCRYRSLFREAFPPGFPRQKPNR